MSASAVAIAVERAEAELTLIESLRRRDPAALETLMERYASRVYRLAYGIMKNEADAEEVVQDVFLSGSTASRAGRGCGRGCTASPSTRR